MNFLFLDDAKQRKPVREGMGELFAVGGVAVSSKNLGQPESWLEDLCRCAELSPVDVFKWSPDKKTKFRGFEGEDRKQFIHRCFDIADSMECCAFVSINDGTRRRANETATDHEFDALLLTLERFNTHAGKDQGFVVVAKPSGGTKDENKFLADCVDHRVLGTRYVQFGNIACNVVTMPFSHSRILQLADLVVSITTAHVSGNDEFTAPLFPRVLALMKEDRRGLKGGAGLKLHPSFSYRNLYHWLLGENCLGSGEALPDGSFPYAVSPWKKSNAERPQR